MDDENTRKSASLVQKVLRITDDIIVNARNDPNDAAHEEIGKAYASHAARWYYSQELFASAQAVEEAIRELVFGSGSAKLGPVSSRLRELARKALRDEAGLSSVDENALSILTEAAKLIPMFGSSEPMSLITLTRLFCGAILVCDRLAVQQPATGKLRVFSDALNAPPWYELRQRTLAQFKYGSSDDAIRNLNSGFSKSTHYALQSIKHRVSFDGTLTASLLIHVMLDPERSYFSSLLYVEIPKIDDLCQDVLSREGSADVSAKDFAIAEKRKHSEPGTLGPQGFHISETATNVPLIYPIVPIVPPSSVSYDDPLEKHGTYVVTRGRHTIQSLSDWRVPGHQ